MAMINGGPYKDMPQKGRQVRKRMPTQITDVPGQAHPKPKKPKHGGKR